MKDFVMTKICNDLLTFPNRNFLLGRMELRLMNKTTRQQWEETFNMLGLGPHHMVAGFLCVVTYSSGLKKKKKSRNLDLTILRHIVQDINF
jgi:hypothetical protein